MYDPEFPMMLERRQRDPKDADEVNVGFGIHPMEDEAKSRAAGHPVYVERLFVRIAVPGDHKSLYFQPATDVHKRDYPQAWAAYQAGEKRPKLEEGDIPITEWPAISKALAWTLKAAHIYSVKALVQLQETHLERFGVEVRDLQAKARAWFEQSKGAAALAAKEAEKAELRNEIETLKGQIASLVAASQQQSASSEAPAGRRKAA